MNGKRILVIGGYGGFGARLSRRLAAGGHRIIVAGRSEAKAAAFAAALPAADPAVMDREGDVAAALARHRPDLVIDAAGPFQASSYKVPEACIVAGIPYLDLADARDFVTGIAALDHAARTRGVAIVSGASTAPALTSAVAAALAAGLDRVDDVDIALSIANRAAEGKSVVAAALSYAGRPLLLWRGGRWARRFGWQGMKRQDFALRDGSGVRGRLVALADVADCALLPTLLPGRPTIVFRAGTELRFQMIALWLMSWPVRWGWLRSLAAARTWILLLHRLTGRIGGLRSAMSVTLAGRRGGERVERRWTIVAERGDGLHIPTLAAAFLAEDALAGRLAPGARHAAGLLDLAQFEPAFAGLAVRHETVERPLPPLYARLLGPVFHVLPTAVRALHDIGRCATAEGQGSVVRGRSLFARLIGAVMRFPPAGTWPLRVDFAEKGGGERWTRDFGGHRFASTLSASGGRVVERFGALRFFFDLPAGPHGLAMHLVRWTCLGIPLPLVLAPHIAAREWEEAGRFRFEVAVAMPLTGEIVRYSGWLVPTIAAAEIDRRPHELAA
ncbi:MAG TPA: SDR family NAD(P)-dependent oxidoreductase [Allosphingosinicella sp.]